MDCEICKLRQAPWWKERAAPVRGDGDETDSRVYVHIQTPEKP